MDSSSEITCKVETRQPRRYRPACSRAMAPQNLREPTNLLAFPIAGKSAMPLSRLHGSCGRSVKKPSLNLVCGQDLMCKDDMQACARLGRAHRVCAMMQAGGLTLQEQSSNRRRDHPSIHLLGKQNQLAQSHPDEIIRHAFARTNPKPLCREHQHLQTGLSA